MERSTRTFRSQGTLPVHAIGHHRFRALFPRWWQRRNKEPQNLNTHVFLFEVSKFLRVDKEFVWSLKEAADDEIEADVSFRIHPWGDGMQHFAGQMIDVMTYLGRCSWLPNRRQRAIRRGAPRAARRHVAQRGGTIIDLLVAKTPGDHGALAPEPGDHEGWRDPLYPFVRGLSAVNRTLTALSLSQGRPIGNVPVGPIDGPVLTCEVLAGSMAIREGALVPGIHKLRQAPDLVFEPNLSRPPSSDQLDLGCASLGALGTALEQRALDARLLRGKEKLLLAQRYLQVWGDTEVAVTAAATAVELTIEEVSATLLWEQAWERSMKTEGDPLVCVETIALFREQNPMERVMRILNQRLRGGSFSKEEGPCGDWAVRCRNLRNRVVHGGLTPTFREAHDALEAAESFVAAIVDRVVETKNIFPRSAHIIATPRGIERRGKYSKGYQKKFRKLADGEPGWRLSLASFHEEIVRQLEAQERR